MRTAKESRGLVRSIQNLTRLSSPESSLPVLGGCFPWEAFLFLYARANKFLGKERIWLCIGRYLFQSLISIIRETNLMIVLAEDEKSNRRLGTPMALEKLKLFACSD